LEEEGSAAASGQKQRAFIAEDAENKLELAGMTGELGIDAGPSRAAYRK
jgi:hypothetical protein